MIDMRYHDLPDWAETVGHEPIVSGMDIESYKDKKLIMRHLIAACEEFYVHNNIEIFSERRTTVPDEFLHPAYMHPSCNQISYSTYLGYITRRQVI